MKAFFTQRNNFGHLLFWILLAVNIYPIFSVAYFYTGDGPAHLYNATLLNDLLFSENPFSNHFFEIRSLFIPNMGGHALLCFFLQFLDPAIAEKMVYALEILLLAVGFKSVLGLREDGNVWPVFLILPLLNNFCFYIGFQSFCLALGLALFVCRLLFDTRFGKSNRITLAFSLLLLFTAWCHIVPAIFVLIAWFSFQLDSLLKKKYVFRVKSLISIFPAIIFSGTFILQNSGQNSFETLDFLEPWKLLLSFQALIPYNLIDQRLAVLFYTALILIGLIFVFIYTNEYQNRATLLTALFLLALYFILPNNFSQGGYLSIRLLLGVFVFLAVFIAFNLSLKFTLVLAPLLIAINIAQIYQNKEEINYLSAYAEKVLDSTQHIPPNMTMVPLVYSSHWIHYNLGLYPSAFVSGANMDNYEASETEFPVRWKANLAPDHRLGLFGSSRRPPFALEPYESETGERIDIVLRIGYEESMTSDSTTVKTNQLLNSRFVKTAQGEKYQVWERKE